MAYKAHLNVAPVIHKHEINDHTKKSKEVYISKNAYISSQQTLWPVS